MGIYIGVDNSQLTKKVYTWLLERTKQIENLWPGTTIVCNTFDIVSEDVKEFKFLLINVLDFKKETVVLLDGEYNSELDFDLWDAMDCDDFTEAKWLKRVNDKAEGKVTIERIILDGTVKVSNSYNDTITVQELPLTMFFPIFHPAQIGE